MKILITGGAGFIGSALVRYLLTEHDHDLLIVDAFTYAGHMSSLAGFEAHPRLTVSRTDLRNADAIRSAMLAFAPDAVMHLAAETHVDRSIDGPSAFIETNITGTFNLLEAVRLYLPAAPAGFRFLHISTDEVYGDIDSNAPAVTEGAPYHPGSPYAASKAASDHLVRAWARTYGVPVVLTHCSNNYGPCQFPEKLIPHMILNALSGQSLPVFGDGQQVRDWLHVDDHVRALYQVLVKGRTDESYNIGSGISQTNLDVVTTLCELLNDARPQQGDFRELIQFVSDRPGHDRRYALNASRIREELHWQASIPFRQGLQDTVAWYLANEHWWQPIIAQQDALRRRGQL